MTNSIVVSGRDRGSSDPIISKLIDQKIDYKVLAINPAGYSINYFLNILRNKCDSLKSIYWARENLGQGAINFNVAKTAQEFGIKNFYYDTKLEKWVQFKINVETLEIENE